LYSIARTAATTENVEAAPIASTAFIANQLMANPASDVVHRVGPFVAGASASELVRVAQELGLHVVPEDEQQGDYFRQRCDGLKEAAEEFYYDWAGSASLVLQKTGESEKIPEFVEYIHCWLAGDRLCGLILYGVNSEAGARGQIDQHEKAFREQAAEITAALSQKYPRNPDVIVNYFHFDRYPLPPQVPLGDAKNAFASVEVLTGTTEDNESKATIEVHYCGPRIVSATKTRPAPDAAAASATESVRRIFCSDEWFVVYDQTLELYVRTIESLHAFNSLVYLSRREMDDIGRRLNSERSASLAAETRKQIDAWKESLRQADEAKQARIAKLTAIL
jgi:hypothetical protein